MSRWQCNCTFLWPDEAERKMKVNFNLSLFLLKSATRYNESQADLGCEQK